MLGKSSDFSLGPQDDAAVRREQMERRRPPLGRNRRRSASSSISVLPVAADGKYQVVVYLTKARDYGVVQFSLDGKPLGKPIDCFEPEKVLATGAIDLGTVELKKGNAVLRLEVVGTNEKSVGAALHVGAGLRGAQAGGAVSRRIPEGRLADSRPLPGAAELLGYL